MAALTVAEIDEAIRECLVYKSTRLDGQTYEFQDLGLLEKLRQRVVAEGRTAEGGGGFFSVVQFVPKSGTSPNPVEDERRHTFTE